MNKEEILKALEVIKKVCSDQKTDCADCPFYSKDYGCNITHNYPKFWEIQGTNDKWRAFYD